MYQRGSLHLSEMQNALNIVVAGVATMLCQTVAVRALAPVLGERGLLLLGACFYLAYLLVYAFALGPVHSSAVQSAGLIYAVALLAPFGWMFASMCPAILSKAASESEQGQVQGAYVAVRSIAGMVGPLLWGWLYGWLADHAASSSPGGGESGGGEGSHDGSSAGGGGGGGEGWHLTLGPSDIFAVNAVLAVLSILVGYTIPGAGTARAAASSPPLLSTQK